MSSSNGSVILGKQNKSNKSWKYVIGAVVLVAIIVSFVSYATMTNSGDCVLSAWGPCDNATLIRKRSVKKAPSKTGKPCGVLEEKCCPLWNPSFNNGLPMIQGQIISVDCPRGMKGTYSYICNNGMIDSKDTCAMAGIIDEVDISGPWILSEFGKTIEINLVKDVGKSYKITNRDGTPFKPEFAEIWQKVKLEPGRGYMYASYPMSFADKTYKKLSNLYYTFERV
jgi:hypothetical protein